MHELFKCKNANELISNFMFVYAKGDFQGFFSNASVLPNSFVKNNIFLISFY